MPSMAWWTPLALSRQSRRIFQSFRRGIVTRYEKTATIYLAGLHIAGIFLWSVR